MNNNIRKKQCLDALEKALHELRWAEILCDYNLPTSHIQEAIIEIENGMEYMKNALIDER